MADEISARRGQRHPEIFIGLIPPPQVLEAYDELVPGSGKMIVDYFAQQVQHRMDHENKQSALVASQVQAQIELNRAQIELDRTRLTADNKIREQGQWIGAALTFTVLGSGIVLTTQGESAGGLAMLFVGLTPLVSKFLHGLRQPHA